MSGWEDNSFIFIRLPVQTYSEREKRERQRKGVWHAVCGCACYMAALVTLCVCVCVRQHRGRFVKPREDCWLAAVTNGPFNVVWTPSPKTLTKPLKIHMAIWTASRLLEGEHICMCVAGKQRKLLFFFKSLEFDASPCTVLSILEELIHSDVHDVTQHH